MSMDTGRCFATLETRVNESDGFTLPFTTTLTSASGPGPVRDMAALSSMAFDRKVFGFQILAQHFGHLSSTWVTADRFRRKGAGRVRPLTVLTQLRAGAGEGPALRREILWIGAKRGSTMETDTGIRFTESGPALEAPMDKPRHPHVIRTWTVERTRALYHPPQIPRVPQREFHRVPPRSRPPAAAGVKAPR